jgi:uncharacterized SAM-binding protein YcdF (DUF218 family)
MRSARRVVGVVLLAAVAYAVLTVGQIWFAAQNDDRSQADAIVVLGAAQYNGQPSPALQDRLDHAVTLYDAGVAPIIWVTGGRQPGDEFSEASASSRYLIRKGVPDTAVQLETNGENSYQSLAAAARYLRDRDQRDVLLVSDPWHAYRIAAIARQVGLHPRVSPASDAELSGPGLRRLAHESVAVGLGRIVGYRRLTGLGERWAPPL